MYIVNGGKLLNSSVLASNKIGGKLIFFRFEIRH